MADEPNLPAASKPNWQPRQLLVMCAVCLVLGFLAGYFTARFGVRAASGCSARDWPVVSANERIHGTTAKTQQMPKEAPTLDDLKRMADKKAAPVLEKLKSDPKNPQLWNQVGLIYKSAHQFKEAAGYFEKSLQYDPKNLGVRADYASCLYYTGDVDGALAQLNQSLTYDPKHAGTLMNIGIIKWRGKNDVDGAVAAWEKLLQYHPDFPQKDLVQQMLTQAKQSVKVANQGQKG